MLIRGYVRAGRLRNVEAKDGLWKSANNDVEDLI
jgi:predicted site-specific integrase-resolvase